jgi:hypothetical protein
VVGAASALHPRRRFVREQVEILARVLEDPAIAAIATIATILATADEPR